MAARWQVVLGVTAAGLVVAAPLVYASQRNTHLRNFRVVEDGVLYRSGQLTPTGLDRVVYERGIKTLVTLRTSRVAGKLPPDTWEEEFCASHGLKHVRIVPRVWGADEKGEIPAEEAVHGQGVEQLIGEDHPRDPAVRDLPQVRDPGDARRQGPGDAIPAQESAIGCSCSPI